jgi:hypothetical protein
MQQARTDVACENLSCTRTQHEEPEAAAVFRESESALRENTYIERQMRGVGLEGVERDGGGGSLCEDQSGGQHNSNDAKRYLCSAFHGLDH